MILYRQEPSSLTTACPMVIMAVVMVVRMRTMVIIVVDIKHRPITADLLTTQAQMMVIETSLTSDAADIRMCNKGMSGEIVY